MSETEQSKTVLVPAPLAGYRWQAPGPGTGQPLVAGPAASVSGPISAPAIYLILLVGWAVTAVVGLVAAIIVWRIVFAVIGALFFSHHDGAPVAL